MKTAFALAAVAAVAAPQGAEAGLCCCTTYALGIVGFYNGEDCVASTDAVYPNAGCKGSPTFVSTSTCSYTKSTCEAKTAMFANTGQRCVWNSAASTALTAAAVVASVVAYAL